VGSEFTAVDERSDLDELLAAGLLVVDGDDVTGRDILAAGVVSGRWPRLERELLEGAGLVAAEAPPDGEVNEELRTFRMDRGLLSAEDLRAWMEKRGLTFAAVKAAAARAVARRRGGEPEPVAPELVASTLPAELICTGALVEMGFWLADRMLSAAIREAETAPPSLDEKRLQRLVFEEARTVAGRASREPGVERAERLRRIAGLDDVHRDWESAAVTRTDLQRRLREKELDWCRYDLDELRLPTAGAAAEAARQLAEGSASSVVAGAASAELTSRTVALADAPAELARLLAGAVPGDVVGAWRDGDDYVVNRVRERRIPGIEDELSVTRGQHELLEDAIARLRAGRIRWYDRA
jgi:hypothetical protein